MAKSTIFHVLVLSCLLSGPIARADEASQLRDAVAKLSGRVEELERKFAEFKKTEMSPRQARRSVYFEGLETKLKEMKGAAAVDGPKSSAETEEAPEQREFSVSQADLDEFVENLPKMLSQARVVPYYRNGAEIGMRFFAIRDQSIYRKIGLKNGDILKAINGAAVTVPADALKMPVLSAWAKPETVLKLERSGGDIELRVKSSGPDAGNRRTDEIKK